MLANRLSSQATTFFKTMLPKTSLHHVAFSEE
jgi:hypothetical protein